MNLFQRGDFTLSSGQRSDWKIECDALIDDDIETLACIGAKLVCPFGRVIGVPRGGLRLAKAIEPYGTDGPTLIVDDVLTTGRSMEIFKQGHLHAKGIVIFARGSVPSWVTPIFRFEGVP